MKKEERTIIIEALSKNEYPMNVKEISEYIKKRGYNIDISTVYRIMKKYEKENIVKIILFGDKKEKKYFLIENPKHYIICEDCGKMKEITGCPLDEFEKKLNEETGFLISHHELSFKGKCKNCRGEKI